MPMATTPAQDTAGYGMATREHTIALSVRTLHKAPKFKRFRRKFFRLQRVGLRRINGNENRRHGINNKLIEELK